MLRAARAEYQNKKQSKVAFTISFLNSLHPPIFKKIEKIKRRSPMANDDFYSLDYY
jgi:hypothetical protein